MRVRERQRGTEEKKRERESECSLHARRGVCTCVCVFERATPQPKIPFLARLLIPRLSLSHKESSTGKPHRCIRGAKLDIGKVMGLIEH